MESNKKESEGNRSTSEEKESRLGQLSNEVKQLQNQVEHFRGTENDIKVGFWLLEMSVIIIFLILRNLTLFNFFLNSAMRKPSNYGRYEHCFPQYSKQSEFQSVLEQHRSVKGEVVDNDNKIVEVNLAHQIKDILLDLNKQLSQEQDEHKNTAEQRNQFKVND